MGIGTEYPKYHSMWTKLRYCTKSLAIRQTAVKIFTRWYYTPAHLNIIFPDVSPNCFRGCDSPGTFLHIFWSFDKLSPFGRK